MSNEGASLAVVRDPRLCPPGLKLGFTLPQPWRAASSFDNSILPSFHSVIVPFFVFFVAVYTVVAVVRLLTCWSRPGRLIPTTVFGHHHFFCLWTLLLRCLAGCKRGHCCETAPSQLCLSTSISLLSSAYYLAFRIVKDEFNYSPNVINNHRRSAPRTSDRLLTKNLRSRRSYWFEGRENKEIIYTCIYPDQELLTSSCLSRTGRQIQTRTPISRAYLKANLPPPMRPHKFLPGRRSLCGVILCSRQLQDDRRSHRREHCRTREGGHHNTNMSDFQQTWSALPWRNKIDRLSGIGGLLLEDFQ